MSGKGVDAMLMQTEREQVAACGRRMCADRLSPGTSGNLSIFDPETGLMAISPSGMEYGEIQPEDVVIADLEGHVRDGVRKPSSEYALHAAFYRKKPQIRAVVHTHSVYCATFSVLGQPIRAVHYVIGDAGAAEVPCAPYHTFGSRELADAAVTACGAGNAVLLANHGLVTCGTSLKSAYSLAQNMEYVAELQYRAMCVGTPQVLSGHEMAHVMDLFQTYGQPRPKKPD